MGKLLKVTNHMTLYVGKNNVPIVEEYNRLIQKDKAVLARASKRPAGAKGLFSISLMIQMYTYVKKHNPDFKLLNITDEPQEEINSEVEEEVIDETSH